ncbi:MAG: PepSY-associated TM helix domain-containing protein [Cytophagaceae bacterium]
MTTEKKKYTFRKLMNDIHLWLGIGSGIILFIICLTGTIYTFAREITEWMDHDKYTLSIPENSQRMSASSLVSSLEKQKSDMKVTNISIPEESTYAWTMTLTPKDMLNSNRKEQDKNKDQRGKGNNDKNKEQRGKENSDRANKDKPKEGAGKDKKFDRSRIKSYWVNPYTGEILGDSKTPTSQFFSTIMGLHRWLLLEHSTGRLITGSATLIFILIEITGLLLWAPAKLRSWSKWNAWKAGFKIKTDGNWKRINHDLHNTLGFYTLLLVTVMAITGLCFSFEWWREGFGNVFGAQPFTDKLGKDLISEYTGGTTVSLDDIIAKGNSTFSYSGSIRVSLPRDSSALTIYSKTQSGFFAAAGVDRVLINQYSGEILATDRFSDKKLGEQIVAMIYPLHVGEIFGTSTKILYFIICLIATSLPVTGTIIWINKLRKKSENKSKGKKGTKKSNSSANVTFKPKPTTQSTEI